MDGDLQVSDDGRSIIAYLETWFNAGKKFHENLNADDTWLNFYATFNPFEDTLKLKYTVESGTFSSTNFYHPTENEEQLIRELIAEKIYQEYGQTPREYCEDIAKNDTIEMGGQS